jgi:hypothetical protein
MRKTIKMTRAMLQYLIRLTALSTLFVVLWIASLVFAEPTATAPLEVNTKAKEVRILGVIYPARFNTAQGEEARYHLIVWKGGTSTNALIETPADDLAFHAALVSIGAQPGDNLTMASWNKRYDPNNSASEEKVTGTELDVRLVWKEKPEGVAIEQAVHQIPSLDSQIPIEWRFGGNRARWFNKVPLGPRPGCLVCLYSCPSGKVSNGALSIHDYVAAPSRFTADTDILPPDGAPVIVTVAPRHTP